MRVHGAPLTDCGSCDHIWCRWARRAVADQTCRYCRQGFQLGQTFTQDTASGCPPKIVHTDCLQRYVDSSLFAAHVERLRAAGRRAARPERQERPSTVDRRASVDNEPRPPRQAPQAPIPAAERAALTSVVGPLKQGTLF